MQSISKATELTSLREVYRYQEPFRVQTTDGVDYAPRTNAFAAYHRCLSHQRSTSTLATERWLPRSPTVTFLHATGTTRVGCQSTSTSDSACSLKNQALDLSHKTTAADKHPRGSGSGARGVMKVHGVDGPGDEAWRVDVPNARSVSSPSHRLSLEARTAP